MTLVTIYVDGSLRQCGAAGAGGYVVRDGVRTTLSLALSRRYPDSSHAEIAAVGAVVWKAGKLGLIRPGDRLLVVTDSQGAIGYLMGKATTRKKRVGWKITPPETRKKGQPRRKPIYEDRPRNPVLVDLAAKARQMIVDLGAELAEVRWTKGHAGGGTKQSWVNEAVDKAAKAASHKARQRPPGSSSAK